MSSFDLKTDFENKSRAAWQNLVEAGLRGAPFDSLNRETEDGLRRGPLMSAQDLPTTLAPLARTDVPLLDGRPWHIASPVRDPDLAHANTQLLDDLKGGASAVRIELGDEITQKSDLKRVLEGVFTDLVPITLTTPAASHVALDIQSLSNAHLNLGFDPMTDEPTCRDVVTKTPETWRTLAISPRHIHDHGGTSVQELAGMAASLADAMRRHGGPIVARHLSVHIAVDQDAHLTITKIRAARRIILQIAKACGADGTQIPIHAVTSLRMMQTIDPWTNLLRVMSAGFGAIIGGAEFVTTRPFTDGLGHATPFSHRIARNMQLMMMTESHLGQVADPAHGSHWHERMTEDLAQAAWADFQRIEGLGGIETYLGNGQFKADLDDALATRAAKGDPILGVTLHPFDGQKMPEVRA